MRACVDCNEIKPLDSFSKQPLSRIDYKTRCKKCCSLRTKKWKESNLDKFNKYREQNKDKIKQTALIYRQNNKDKLAAKFAKYHASKCSGVVRYSTSA